MEVSLVICIYFIFSLDLLCLDGLCQLFLNTMGSFEYFIHIVFFHVFLADDLAEIFAVEFNQLREDWLEIDEQSTSEVLDIISRKIKLYYFIFILYPIDLVDISNVVVLYAQFL